MTDWLHAGTWEELQEQGAKVIKGGIAVFVHADEVYAVDNRCPHMGFPLHMGSLCDGILTCHWHHARFDVCSGGTLDPWADDVPVHRVKVERGSVWVDPRPQVASSVEKQLRRLREGMEQNLSLVIAKSVVALVESGVPAADIARVGVEFGTTYRSAGWSSGLTILAAMVNVLPKLDKYGRILALYHGLARVARDCAGQPARFLQQPLPETEQQATEHLSAWYRRCMEVRDMRGAERVLASAIASGMEPNELMSMMMTAVTDHFYMDGGHTLDFHNKAFEILQHIGSDSAVRVRSSLVPLPARATRSEELQHWQSPVNLVEPLREAFRELEGMTWSAAETPLRPGARRSRPKKRNSSFWPCFSATSRCIRSRRLRMRCEPDALPCGWPSSSLSQRRTGSPASIPRTSSEIG
ncbi:Rieske (2Fe-2S) protein [Paenibacillus thiaminolyticus]|uniref:Rieske (2Fe-2S) protein n=1 Tax=Paenibacillus thiaminolyticus TaxID=49283 RepID=UPI0021759258|nr:Rieske (2Fe-2S) protein [Paenibacillus thiaminolyticus]